MVLDNRSGHLLVHVLVPGEMFKHLLAHVGEGTVPDVVRQSREPHARLIHRPARLVYLLRNAPGHIASAHAVLEPGVPSAWLYKIRECELLHAPESLERLRVD